MSRIPGIIASIIAIIGRILCIIWKSVEVCASGGMFVNRSRDMPDIPSPPIMGISMPSIAIVKWVRPVRLLNAGGDLGCGTTTMAAVGRTTATTATTTTVESSGRCAVSRKAVTGWEQCQYVTPRRRWPAAQQRATSRAGGRAGVGPKGGRAGGGHPREGTRGVWRAQPPLAVGPVWHHPSHRPLDPRSAPDLGGPRGAPATHPSVRSTAHGARGRPPDSFA